MPGRPDADHVNTSLTSYPPRRTQPTRNAGLETALDAVDFAADSKRLFWISRMAGLRLFTALCSPSLHPSIHLSSLVLEFHLVFGIGILVLLPLLRRPRHLPIKTAGDGILTLSIAFFAVSKASLELSSSVLDASHGLTRMRWVDTYLTSIQLQLYVNSKATSVPIKINT
ncbi:hypothetical protein C8R45DRAFT_1090553 [Mycena sanguinolenta]|nr:hypothetical protein C8R45DRAFT_1090553 [Mycena sanguinolenta]